MSKKVFFVVHNFSSESGGGVNRVVAETANELSKKLDYQINIVSLSKLNGTCYPLNERVNLHSLEMEKYSTTQYKGIFKIFWLFFAFVNVYRFYLKNRMPATWNVTSPPLIILFSLFKKYKNQFLYCEHTSPLGKKNNFIKNKIRSIFLNTGDLTISLNSKDDAYYKSIGVNSQLIYNGSTFPYEYTKEVEKSIIFVGRFVYEKDPLEALQIFYESALWEKGYKLKFFGYGSYLNNLILKATELDILENIEIITNERNPDKIYANACVLVMTSLYEGLPMVLVEAMSRGIPCISYNCPQGPSEIIKNGVNGYLIPVSDRKEFIHKLGLVVNNSIQPELIIESVQDFNISNVIQQWEYLIESQTNI